jgi:hypothetical protein
MAALRQSVDELKAKREAENTGGQQGDVQSHEPSADEPKGGSVDEGIPRDQYVADMLQKIKSFKGWEKIGVGKPLYRPAKGSKNFAEAVAGDEVTCLFYAKSLDEKKQLKVIAVITLKIKSKDGKKIVAEVVRMGSRVREDGRLAPGHAPGVTISGTLD